MVDSSEMCRQLATCFELVVPKAIQIIGHLVYQGRSDRYIPGSSGLLIDHLCVVAGCGVQKMEMGST